MAMRRRIKPNATLVNKRKPKIVSEDKKDETPNEPQQVLSHVKEGNKSQEEHSNDAKESTNILGFTNNAESTEFAVDSQHSDQLNLTASTDKNVCNDGRIHENSRQNWLPANIENSSEINNESNINETTRHSEVPIAIWNEEKVETAIQSESTKQDIAVLESNTDLKNDDKFKFPKRIEFNHSASWATPSTRPLDEEDDGTSIMQMDLQKSTAMCPLSPTRQPPRQRVKPMPLCGQRRNSVTTPAILDEPMPTETIIAPMIARRERHHSASYNSGQSPNIQAQPHNNFTNIVPKPSSTGHGPHIANNSISSSGRVRTESNCSAFSDSYHISSPAKPRKIDEQNQFRNQSKRDFEARFSNGVPDKSSLKMFDLIYFNPVTNPMGHQKHPQIKPEKDSKDDIRESGENIKQEEDSKDSNHAFPVPQLKLTADGEMIIDEKSLEIETTAEQEARKILAKSSLIYVDENTGMNGFYKRRNRTKEWPPEETIKFYRILQYMGSDFQAMCSLLKGRSRRDVKLKFKREERNNPSLITKALLYPSRFNVDELKKQFETEEQEKEEEERRWKELQAEASKPFKKVQVNTSRAARALTYSDQVYKHESVPRKRKYRKLNEHTEKNAENNEKRTTKDEYEKIQTKAKTRLPRHPKKSKSENLGQSNENSDVPDINSQNIKTEPIHPNEGMSNIEHIKNINTLRGQQQVSSEQQILSKTPENITCDQTLSQNDHNINLETDVLSLFIENKFEEGNTQFGSDNKPIARVDSGVSAREDMPRTIMNMDNGSVMVVEDDECSSVDSHLEYIPVSPPLPAEASSPLENVLSDNGGSEYDANEIEKILTDIADGNLVVVSTLNPKFPDHVTNEIYMLNKDTGELFDNALDVPKDIVDAILEVMV